MVNNRIIARNTFFLYLRMALVLLVSLYTTRVLLSALGINDYGLYSVIGGLVALFSFINATMSSSVQRFYNYERGAKSYSETEVFNTSLQIQVAFITVLFVLLETIGLWYINQIMVYETGRKLAVNIVYQTTVLSFILVLFQVPYSAAVIAHEKMDYFALIGITDVILRLIIVLILPLFHFDKLITYSFLQLIISVLNFILYFGYCKKHFKGLVLRPVFHKSLFMSMLSFAGWNTFDMIAFTLKSQGPTLLLNAYFGPVVNAARAISMQIMSAIQGFSSNVMTAFKPQLTESYASRDYNTVRHMMYNMTKISYMVFLMLTIPVVFEIHYILYIWLNGEVPDYTVVFTTLCLIDMLICSLNAPLSYVAQSVGKIRNYNIIRSLLILLIIPVSWIILHYGANPASVYWVSIIIVLLNQPVSMALLKEIFDYSYNEYITLVILPCVLFSIVTICVSYVPHFFMGPGLLRLLIVCIIDVSVSCSYVYFFVLSKGDREKVDGFLKLKFHFLHSKITNV